MRTRDREQVPLPVLDGLDGLDVAKGEHREVLRRIARGAVRGAWRRAFPQIALMPLVTTWVVYASIAPWEGARTTAISMLVVPLPLAYSANLLAIRLHLADALKNPDCLVVLSADRCAALTLRRAGSPARPLWVVGWHGAEHVGARYGARLRARLLPEVLGQADRLGVTLKVTVPRRFLHVARTELPGCRTSLVLPGVRVLVHGGERRTRVTLASPVASAAIGEAALIEETERIDAVEEYEVDVILVPDFP